LRSGIVEISLVDPVHFPGAGVICCRHIGIWILWSCEIIGLVHNIDEAASLSRLLQSNARAKVSVLKLPRPGTDAHSRFR